MWSRVAGAAVAVAAGLAAAGCGAGGSAASVRAPVSGQVGRNVTTGKHVGSTDGTVGPGCNRLPATGPGSISDMAAEPVATAVARSPLLTELARAIRRAALTGKLDSATAITVFAPDDAAFAALGRSNLTTLLADTSDLTKVLGYHLVSGRQTPADLARGKHLTTLPGTVIVPAKSHGKYRVNNAEVICGNLQAANATIYIVNKVLVPIP